MLRTTLTLAFSLALAGIPAVAAPPRLSPADAEAQLAKRAAEVVAVLATDDLAKLAPFVHRAKGLRFSPYGRMGKKDVIFQAIDLPTLWSDGKVYVWGRYIPSGDAISLRVPEYWPRFVYGQDFAHAPQVAYNRVIDPGKLKENSADFYPGSAFAEYFVPGDAKGAGVDWEGLRLVFEKEKEEWRLVAIVHSGWTP
jgi:hypothetical protein